MTDFKLYVCPIPDNDQTTGESSRQPENALQGLLGQDTASAERISTPPGEQRIILQYKGRYADVMAGEVEELADSDGYAEVPLFGQTERTNADGYYLVDDSRVGPADPRERRIQDVDLTLSRSGTRDSHLRAVTTEPRTVDHPFGNDTTALVSAPAAATDVRWVDPTTQAAEAASALATHATEHGDVTTYDLADASFWSPSSSAERGPILVYDIAYDAIGPVDVRVWDRRGYATRDDSDGLPRWAKVFVSTHGYEGDAAVIENGRRRITLDPDSDPGIAVEQWDDANSQWTGVALDTSGDAADWTLQAFDIGRRTDQSLAPTRVDALTRWRNTTTDDTYALDVTLRRGAGAVQFARLPDATSPVPSGLVTLLDPVASERIVHPTADQTIRPRSKVGES